MAKRNAARYSSAEAFDHLAIEYDAWYRTPLGAFCDSLKREAIFSLAEVKLGDWVLDVSCGTGNYALDMERSCFFQ